VATVANIYEEAALLGDVVATYARVVDEARVPAHSLDQKNDFARQRISPPCFYVPNRLSRFL
jgi:hypothetical protein